MSARWSARRSNGASSKTASAERAAEDQHAFRMDWPAEFDLTLDVDDLVTPIGARTPRRITAGVGIGTFVIRVPT